MKDRIKIGLLVGYYAVVLWAVVCSNIFVAAGISILGGYVIDKLLNLRLHH